MYNLPFSFLNVICFPPFADLLSLCSLEGTEDRFFSWFHSTSQQHLKGVVIALHMLSILFVFLSTLHHLFSFTSSSHVLL